MFLSSLEIDLSKEAGRRWLSDPYRVHQRLHMAFPDGTKPILYRVEIRRRPPRIVIQSPVEGDWRRCFEDLAVVRRAVQKDLRELPGRLYAGQRLQFLLRANPTARRGPRPDGRRKDG